MGQAAVRRDRCQLRTANVHTPFSCFGVMFDTPWSVTTHIVPRSSSVRGSNAVAKESYDFMSSSVLCPVFRSNTFTPDADPCQMSPLASISA